MAHFYRLILIVLSLCFSANAISETISATTTGTTAPQVPYFVTFGYSGFSGSAACSSYAASQWSNYSAVGFAGIASPRTVQCSGTFPTGSGVYNTFKHQWVCKSGSTVGLQDVDAPTAQCAPVYTCPATGGWTLSGSSCTRPDCPAGVTRDSNGVCISKCPVSQVATATVGVGWFPAGPGGVGLVSPASALAAAPTSICVQNSANKCTASVSPGSLNLKTLTNNNWAVSANVSGTLTGAECTGVVTPAEVTAPPPPCAGQSGTLNGVEVCLPTETEAQKRERASEAAKTAASLAAAAARSAVLAAGGTSEAADAAAASAGAAAGSAASTAIMAGSSPAGAAAAGAAAGSSAASGATKTATQAASSAAAARSAAEQQAISRGLTGAQVTAAGDAAAKAASTAINSGQSTGAAEAAGRAAGETVASGGTPAQGADAGAGAGAGVDGKNGTNGTPGVDGKDGESMTDFCIKNPAAVICKEAVDSVWTGGDCRTPPICKGDAIACAIAAQTFKAACALVPPANDESDLYDAEKVKVDTVIVDDLPGSETVGINSGMFSQTNVLGGGSSGMSDLNVTVAGHSVTLPFTTINTVLTWLGYILLAVGFLLSSRIVVRG